MALMGDRYLAEFDGHRVELVRNNLEKTLALWIDGAQVQSESRILPHDITLTASFVGQSGKTHNVVAKSIVHGPHIGRFAFGLTADDHIEIDGQSVPVKKLE